jgi:hypothetical protein
VSAGFVHGKMTNAQRDIALGRLRRPPEGGWSVVANAKCLTEGVDIPDIDSVLFAAPKDSVTDIVQAAGRPLRLSAEARTAAIIVPAVLPDDGDWDEDGSAGRWDNVVRVVRALAAHDDRLAVSLTAARAARPARPPDAGPQLPDPVCVQAPPGTSARILEALSVRIIDAATSPWPQWLALLREYHREHGHADVPQRYRAPDGRQLGHWLARQRQALASGTLAAGQAAALAELGVTRSPHDAAWERGLAHAAAYHAAHGHLNVPFSWASEDGFPLGYWLGSRRKEASAGTLGPGRAAQLGALGFRAQARARDAFQRGLRHLDAYIAEHGHARVPVSYTAPDGYRLGNWVSSKRTTRRSLPAADKAALDNRGMTWDARSAVGRGRPGTGQHPPAPAQPRAPAARDAAPDPAPRRQEDPRP